MGTEVAPEVQRQHMIERYGPKFVEKTEKAHDKALAFRPADHHDKAEENNPPGGFDDTPFPHAPPGYTLKFTFHRANNLPAADFGTLSSDPFVHAELKTDLPKRHKQDPNLIFRTPTIRRNVNPVWDAEWIVANVPASGFHLKCRVYDEDPADHDDKLGNAHVVVDRITDDWAGIKEGAYHLKKRAGSKRAYMVRTVVAALSASRDLNAELIVSVEWLGRTESDNGAYIYTVGPIYWFKHFSPLIGRLLGTSGTSENQNAEGKTTPYNFQAIEIQLEGPVPDDLYHRYVEFKPFVAGMFTSHSLRGRILNRALHHQHARIYNFDRSTMNGTFPGPCTELTKLFLDFVDHGRGGRIFTYILTLDGQLRFTETGKEFGIDLLSKHTMHSDVSIYVAFSGEFFVRPSKKHRRFRESITSISSSRPRTSESGTELGSDEVDVTEKDQDDCSAYELIIDNDSGTYRPNAEKLPLLREFLSKNFPGLQITTLDCQKDAERMNRLKEQRRAEKQRARGNMVYTQQVNGSSSSLSSSDEQDLLERAGQATGTESGKHHIHDLKDVKSKFRDWIEADGTVDGHAKATSNEKPPHNENTNGEASNDSTAKAAAAEA
ncbi:C2 domain protein [Talaromyces stipitatus ATCC 10500]|uniref:C2 domain protein n=1 Tax=Talaromyces stipitatus (strain ATCC 10500 / CBS 375.48 / QM 6759 / NRRL 1006) TaxID=441959 RepID=B8LZH3_TALSN|nr:C2 domain protein [Talaromyces stipitatus ATCC 10500]EED21726.1 C2 domain protein [Talaromyces stipitatus ATCC 10500]